MKREAIFCFDTATVRFAIYPDGFDGARVVAQIAEDPLRDLFGADGGGDTLLAAYDRHADTIDEVAAAHFRRTPHLPILLHTSDFDRSAIYRMPPRRNENGRPASHRATQAHAPSELAA